MIMMRKKLSQFLTEFLTKELTKFANLDMKNKNVNNFKNQINKWQNFIIDQESLTKFAIIDKLKSKEVNVKKRYI